MSSACQLPGTPAMYGLGIRVGFYTLWFGTVLANWLARPLVPSLRLLLPLFTVAAFLALVIRTAWATLLPVEVYIMLLLVYGAYYCWLPLYSWRLATGCNPFYDPSQWPFVRWSPTWYICNFVLMLAITCFQIWFWCTGINALPETVGTNSQAGCPSWGYFLAQVPLDSAIFIAFNLLFMFILLICIVGNLLYTLEVLAPPRWLRKQQKKANKHAIPKERQVNLVAVQTLSDIIVLSVVTVGVELTIQWNGIVGVNDLSTADQLIPLIIGSGLFVHLIYAFFVEAGDEDESTESSSTSESVIVEVVRER